MAEPAPGILTQGTRFVSNVLTGQHALSKFIPVALWLADAVGTSLIIWKVPCALRLIPSKPITELTCVYRHRDRLGGIYATGFTIHLRRTRLYQDRGRHGSSRVSSCACLHFHRIVPYYGRGQKHFPRTRDLWRSLYGDTCSGHALLLESQGKPQPEDRHRVIY